jgi:hypothetical protein
MGSPKRGRPYPMASRNEVRVGVLITSLPDIHPLFISKAGTAGKPISFRPPGGEWGIVGTVSSERPGSAGGDQS